MNFLGFNEDAVRRLSPPSAIPPADTVSRQRPTPSMDSKAHEGGSWQKAARRIRWQRGGRRHGAAVGGFATEGSAAGGVAAGSVAATGGVTAGGSAAGGAATAGSTTASRAAGSSAAGGVAAG